MVIVPPAPMLDEVSEKMHNGCPNALVDTFVLATWPPNPVATAAGPVIKQDGPELSVCPSLTDGLVAGCPLECPVGGADVVGWAEFVRDPAPPEGSIVAAADGESVALDPALTPVDVDALAL